MKKKIMIGTVILIVIALIAINLLKRDKGIPVDVERIERGTVIQKVTGSGQIRPEVEVNVSANVAGKIIRLHADEGNTVKKGELLVELDQEQYLAAVERNKSNLLFMRANEKKFKSELVRAKDLHSKGLMSEAEYESAAASFEAAESNSRQAEAAVKEAQDMLAKTHLHADMDGIVTRLNKEEGEMALGAQFQEDVIMTVADLSKMEAAIEVDENEVVNVSLGDTAEIEIDAFVDTTFKGIVMQIANTATIKALGTQDQVTNFEVVVALLDYNQKFRPGMSTTVDIFTEIKHDVLRVPIQAVTVREKEKLTKSPGVEEQYTDNDETINGERIKDREMTEIVFCVEGNKAVFKPIKLGISDDTDYEILSGLNEGELVITGPFTVVSRTLNSGDLVEYNTKKEEK